MIILSKRGQTFALLSSIFLNIALLAIIFAGPALLPPKGPPPPHKMMAFMSEDLNPANKVIFDAVFDKYVDRLEQNREEMHAAIDGMTTTMRGDPLEPAAMEEAHEQMRLVRNDLDTTLAQFMTELSQKLSVTARRKLRLFPHPPPK